MKLAIASFMKEIYEKAGVEEFWIVEPQGKSVEIYYSEDGKYILEESWILQDDKKEEHYNAEMVICLKEFLHIKITLEDIFEGIKILKMLSAVAHTHCRKHF